MPEEFETSDESIPPQAKNLPDLNTTGLSSPQGDTVSSGTKTASATGMPQATPGDKGEPMTAEQAEALLQVFSNPLYSARQPTQTL